AVRGRGISPGPEGSAACQGGLKRRAAARDRRSLPASREIAYDRRRGRAGRRSEAARIPGLIEDAQDRGAATQTQAARGSMDDHELAADVIGDEPLASVLGHFEYGRKGLGAREAQKGEAAVVADLAGLNPAVALDRIGEIARPLDRALLKF